MSCSGTSNCSCGCCAGTGQETPQFISNPPGLTVLSRRVGTYDSFKTSLLAGLSSSANPALGGLTTRLNSDFTVAFLD
ncbi:MAG TPA: hypothetical protein VN963_01645, partial [bacterium]|nr:hypothetical protein [bacterium]